MSDRRKHCRYAFVIPVEVICAGGQLRGSMLDISRDGARIVVDLDIAVGSSAFMRLEVSGREAEAIGSVIWIDHHGGAPCYGLHLHAGNEAYVDLIDALEKLPETARAHELAALRRVTLQLG